MLWFFKDILSVFNLLLFIVYSYFELIFRCIFPSSLKSLEGETILVTGSASGIGHLICLQLSRTKPGPTIVCWDINEYENDQVVWKLKQNGIKAFAYTVDVSERAEVERTANKVRREVGPITMLINNAGIQPCHSFLHHNPKEIMRTFEVNVYSQFWTIRHFLPEMLENVNGGHIVTVCSVIGGLLPGGKNLVPYSASQHAVHGYIESLKYELNCYPKAKSKIRFTTIYPSFSETSLLKNVKFITRFPSILSMSAPEYVAFKAVEGIRRGSEAVYIPSKRIKILLQLFNTFPQKVQRAILNLLDYHLEPEVRSLRQHRQSTVTN